MYNSEVQILPYPDNFRSSEATHKQQQKASNVTASFHKPTTADHNNDLSNKHAQLDMLVSDQQALNKQRLRASQMDKNMGAKSTSQDNTKRSELYKTF